MNPLGDLTRFYDGHRGTFFARIFDFKKSHEDEIVAYLLRGHGTMYDPPGLLL